MKKKYGAPLAIHSADQVLLAAAAPLELALLLGAKPSPIPDRFLEEGDELVVGRNVLKVVHLPGHTPGSVGFLADSVLFSGDTLFFGGVGRTDLPGGSWKDLEASIRRKIMTLPDPTVILPGHGPWTTVGQEKETNPFLA
jgi:hydroxyacylglutathione hydrolase